MKYLLLMLLLASQNLLASRAIITFKCEGNTNLVTKMKMNDFGELVALEAFVDGEKVFVAKSKVEEMVTHNWGKGPVSAALIQGYNEDKSQTLIILLNLERGSTEGKVLLNPANPNDFGNEKFHCDISNG